ncbi:MAG TPA: T9SS type A sorting domain-containing protein, partial [Cryomorphaceae bacterium]|nr:T9SS type A sorting domain-containing protein [Cryomorphaceae bacterium]
VSFEVFPNPNTGNFNFRMGDLIADRTYNWELRNTIGQIIDSGDFVPSGSDHTESLSVRSRAQGIYLLSISDGVTVLKVSRVSIQN